MVQEAPDQERVGLALVAGGQSLQEMHQVAPARDQLRQALVAEGQSPHCQEVTKVAQARDQLRQDQVRGRIEDNPPLGKSGRRRPTQHPIVTPSNRGLRARILVVGVVAVHIQVVAVHGVGVN